MKASSHNLDRLRIDFDAPGLVANAGLVLPATLAQHLGLPALLRQHVRLGKAAGAANPDRKALTVIASLTSRQRTCRSSSGAADTCSRRPLRSPRSYGAVTSG